MSESVHVALGARAYDVMVGHGLIARAGELIAPFAPSGRVFVVTDANVMRALGEAVMASLAQAGASASIITVEPGEGSKSFAGLERVCGELLRAGVSRRDLVIALGGGMIGDLAGLAAGLVKRGVDFVQMPTTLLAQVDSSVGGKTAIDTREGKNLVGLIHQPRLVLADLDALATLPPREMACGYAEIVKVGLIGDAAFFKWCEDNANAVLAHAPEELGYAVTKAVAFKARVVEADEREEGPRALLNLGHTFAHALEAHAGYDDALKHGEAVAAGISLAFKLSAALGQCSESDAALVTAHLERVGLKTDLSALPGAPYDPQRLLGLMYADKKAESGRLTFILARAPGRAFIDKDVPADVVRELLEQETGL